jgi:hypothetical protein
MVIPVILALHGQAFESARISGNYYCFVLPKWKKRALKNKNRQEDAGIIKYYRI